MTKQIKLSNVTRDYLICFCEILDEMIFQMTEAELTDSISHNFIMQMIPHHMAAINMSHNLLRYTTNIPLQNIALDIISEQTKSIRNMQNILDCCSTFCNSHRGICLYQNRFNQISQTMFSEMRNACFTNDVNVNFIREMIPHHEGAIRMSENTLRFEICPELKPVLNAIIVSQKKGVKEMERLLKCITWCSLYL